MLSAVATADPAAVVLSAFGLSATCTTPPAMIRPALPATPRETYVTAARPRARHAWLDEARTAALAVAEVRQADLDAGRYRTPDASSSATLMQWWGICRRAGLSPEDAATLLRDEKPHLAGDRIYTRDARWHLQDARRAYGKFEEFSTTQQRGSFRWELIDCDLPNSRHSENLAATLEYFRHIANKAFKQVGRSGYVEVALGCRALADHLGCTFRTAARYLRTLCDLGHLRIVRSHWHEPDRPNTKRAATYAVLALRNQAAATGPTANPCETYVTAADQRAAQAHSAWHPDGALSGYRPGVEFRWSPRRHVWWVRTTGRDGRRRIRTWSAWLAEQRSAERAMWRRAKAAGLTIQEASARYDARYEKRRAAWVRAESAMIAECAA